MTKDIIKNIPLTLDINARKRLDGSIDIRLYSKDIATGQFEFTLIDENENPVVLDETYSAQALVKYEGDSKTYLNDMIIEGNIIRFIFPHDFITKDGTITMYIYITKDNYTSDVAAISFPVFVSEIDKDLDPSISVHYIGKIEQLIEDMRKEIDDQKRALLDEIMSNTDVGNINKYHQEFTDVMKELSKDQDYHSLPEISGARRGYQTLNESLNNLSFKMFNTNLGKVTPNMVSDELLAQIAGDAAVNATPGPRSITTDRLAFGAVSPSETSFLSLGKNLFDLNNVKENYMFDSLGNETMQEGYIISNPIPVKINQPLYITYGTSQPRTHLTSNRIILYKSDGSFLQVLSGFASGNVIGNTEAHTFKVSFTKNVANNLLQVEYGEATDYKDYMYSLDTSIKISGENLTGAEINLEVDDNAVTNQKIAPQAVSEDKTTFLPTGRNKFDPEAIKPNVMFNSAGDEVVHENYCLTGYIPVSDGDRPYISYNGTEIMSNRIVLYDHNQNKIRVISGFASGTIINEPNVGFMRLSITKSVAQGKFQVEFGEMTPYEEFHFQMSSRVKVGDKRLAGKTMIAFGDSITQDAHERSHYPLYFEDLTGVRYINQGYGGTTMSRHTLDEFRPFSVTNLLKAKLDNDYSAQDAVITAWESGTQEEVLRAGNYRLQLEKWKSVNLDEVYAVTLLLGANDHGATIGEIDNIDPEGATFIGAYNHVIKTLQTMHPTLRIILITPIYREHAEGVVDRTPLFVQAVKDIAAFNNLPVYDAYHNLGFNQYNWSHYSNDGLHPIIEVGQPRMGEAISRFLNSVL